MTTPPDAARRAALRALEAVLVVVGAYALAMILLGSTVNRAFDALGFGIGDYAATATGPRAYALLLQGVIGAVIVGWVILLLAVVRHGLGPDPDGPWWTAVVTSAAPATGGQRRVGHPPSASATARSIVCHSSA